MRRRTSPWLAGLAAGLAAFALGACASGPVARAPSADPAARAAAASDPQAVAPESSRAEASEAPQAEAFEAAGSADAAASTAEPEAEATGSDADGEQPPAQADLAEPEPEATSGISDPIEGMNRRIFWFNEGLDRYAIEPAAVAWDFVLPHPVQVSIRNVFDNASFPVTFINNVLQLKPLGAAKSVGRFVMNTTVGIAGIWDPAADVGLPAQNEDFGQTLGYWGVPPGPYLVLPILGPSNPRDLVGLAGDFVGQIYPLFSPAIFITLPVTAVNVLNRRSLLIEEIRDNRESAFDYYVFVRNAFTQYRENQVIDARVEKRSDEEGLYFPEEEDEDLYNPDDAEDFYYPDEAADEDGEPLEE